jgi:hypothetical protein
VIEAVVRACNARQVVVEHHGGVNEVPHARRRALADELAGAVGVGEGDREDD